jgi:hypothetical protein
MVPPDSFLTGLAALVSLDLGAWWGADGLGLAALIGLAASLACLLGTLWCNAGSMAELLMLGGFLVLPADLHRCVPSRRPPPAPGLVAGGRPAPQPAPRDAAGPPAACLFQEPWWLDAAAPGQWAAVELVRDGQVVGRLPFMRKRRFGLTLLTQPPLTPYLGPWLAEVEGKPEARLGQEHALLQALIAALPPHDIFVQTCHPSFTNGLALHWCGFAETVGYSYVIDDLAEPAVLWVRLAAPARTNIRKAERRLRVRPCDDVELLIALNRMTFARQGLVPPYDPDLVRRLAAACQARGAGRMLLAEDEAGQPHAATYLVWDRHCAYSLLSGSDPAQRQSGAVYLLKWAAIQLARQVSRRFDCTGSMLPQVEPTVRALGTRQVRYARLVRGRTARGRITLVIDELRRGRR